MQQILRHQFWIAAAAAIIFFTNLGVPHLWDEDETVHATCAREMVQNDDWVVPTFNGQIFPDKPPLMFWLMISGFKLFGMTELAVRFWSAVFGLGTALLTYHLGRLLFRESVGLWAGLITASTVIFTVSARAATVDSALVFFNTLALTIFILGGVGARPRHGQSTADWQGAAALRFLPGPWWSFVLLYAAIGVTILGKGPIGFLLPVATMGLFLLIANRMSRGPDLAATAVAAIPDQGQPAAAQGRIVRWSRALGRCLLHGARLLTPGQLWRAGWQLRPLTAILIVAAIALPWYVLVGMRTDGQWLRQFFGEHNLQRAFRPFQSHSGPVIYYIPAIFIGFFPWSVFLVPSLVALIQRIRQGDAYRMGLVFLSCWMGLWLVFWSMVSTKLPHYVLPMYPALALTMALFLDDWLREPEKTKGGWLTNALATLIVVGVGFVVAMPILARIFLPGEGLLGLVGLVLVVGGLVCFRFARRQRYPAVLATFAVTSVVFLTAIFGVAALRVDRHQNAPHLIAAIRASGPEPKQLASYCFVRQSFVWYAGEYIQRLNNARDLEKFLQSAPNPCVITNSDRLAEIETAFPGVLEVLTRERRFAHSGEVLVLARKSSPAMASREAACRE